MTPTIAQRAATLWNAQIQPAAISRTTAIVLAAMLSTAARPADFDCLVKPYGIVEIHAPTAGRIDKITVDQGDSVEAGETLVVLESSVERAATELARYRSESTGAVMTAQAKFDNAQLKSGRKAQLHKDNFVSTEARDEAVSDTQVARAQLQEAHENKEVAKREYQHMLAQLALRTIKSPISGVVTERILNRGDVAELGVGQKPVLRLAQIDPLRVEVILPLSMYGKVKVGMPVRIEPEAPIGGPFEATVKVMDKVIDAASATFGVRVELANKGNRIPAGIRCKANFDIPNRAEKRSANP